jgi:transposase-like protein
MKEKRNAHKRTTPEMSAIERLRKWNGQRECPYCGSKDIHENENARGGKHFSCGKCKAENFFSNKNLLRKCEA